eukprot:scaffold12091_cov69-Phaeocystis_antarctica.AAC.1
MSCVRPERRRSSSALATFPNCRMKASSTAYFIADAWPALPPPSTAALCAARRSRSDTVPTTRASLQSTRGAGASGVRRHAWTEHLCHLGCEAGLVIGASGGAPLVWRHHQEERHRGSALRRTDEIIEVIIHKVLPGAAEPAAGVEDGHRHGHRRSVHTSSTQLSSSAARVQRAWFKDTLIALARSRCGRRLLALWGWTAGVRPELPVNSRAAGSVTPRRVR